MASPTITTRLDAIAARYALPAGATERFEMLLELVATEHSSITSVRDPNRGVNVHVADSLVALELDAVRRARRIADLGSGGGFPGLALAIARPEAEVALVESVGRKCAFLERAVAALAVGNATVVNARAEAWPGGIGAHDLVTVRAVAALGVLVEYAAPLLVQGGALVAWKGAPIVAEEADAAAAAAALGMTRPVGQSVRPFPKADERTLYLSEKVSSTPNGYPRRPGMARKRPFRASG